MNKRARRLRDQKFLNVMMGILFVLIYSLTLICIFQLGFFYGQGKGYDFNFILGISEIKDLEECKGLNLMETSNCLVRYTKTFYNYTVSPDTLKTAEYIKEYGGDCFDYANLYVSMAEELGYHGTVSSFVLERPVGHAVAIISNKYGYCVLDQLTNPYCYYLTFPNE